MALATEFDSLFYVKIALGGVILSITVSLWIIHCAVGIYRELTHKNRSDKNFTNGFSIYFHLRLVLEGMSVDNMFKIISETARNRLYTAIRLSLFSTDELWIVAHPAIVKEIFGPGTSRNWVKANQTETMRLTMQKKSNTINGAMLYTGDDAGWKHARVAMGPFFYQKDFTTMDKDMDRIIGEHMDRAVSKNGGHSELLNMTLEITIDLIVQLLYGIALPRDKFKILVKALAGYIVPGSPTVVAEEVNLPGGMSCFDYHRHVGVEIGRNATPGTLASVICASDLPEELKDENLAFFLEALTPAFAAFWAISHALLDKTGEMAKKCLTDPIFRQQCIKEALRMYPPVPTLWPRVAQKNLEIPNPLYDERKTPKGRSWLGSKPIEEGKTIKIKKGTACLVFPSALHYDERYWFDPHSYKPERWDKDPFVLEMKNNASSNMQDPSIKIAKRKTVNFGGLLSTATDSIKRKSRSDLLEESSKFFSGNKTDSNIRNFMFGDDHESFMSDASYDNLAVRTHPTVMDLQAWCYMPFGLGMHACMGRRLALRMVDAMLYNFLDNGVTFYHGMVPSMFLTKGFHERIVATAAVYNMPADPAYITVSPIMDLSFKEKANMRVSIVDYVELRKSGIKSKKLLAVLAEAMLAEDSDDSGDEEE